MPTKDDFIFMPWMEVAIGPWYAISFREIDLNQKSDYRTALEQATKQHPPDCPWWQDWHACNCGAFE